MDLPAQVVMGNNAFKLAMQQCTGLLQYTSQYLMVVLTVGHCLLRVDRPRIINDLLTTTTTTTMYLFKEI